MDDNNVLLYFHAHAHDLEFASEPGGTALCCYAAFVKPPSMFGKPDVTAPLIMLVLAGVLASKVLATEGEHPKKALPLDVERICANQERLVRMALDKVRPSDEGVTETYFVGFGSHAAQDVFESEVKLVEAKFREHLGAEGRTAMLINSRNTVDDFPLANGPNLSAVLSGIGRKMGVEDLLVLHMTSHGSRRHRFSVRFKPFGMKSLSAERIGEIVKDAALPWHVVIVSACFSGGYIDALKSPQTMVITASDASRRSFGCETGRDYTYFGAAFYRDSLFDNDYRAAFERAAVLVRQREESKGYKPSLPQIWVGELIEDKLPRSANLHP